jgi:hypothetical protein
MRAKIVSSRKLIGASLLAPWVLAGGMAQGQSPGLPPLESLTADSDYSAFMEPAVDAEIRRQALRKLFHSEKFATVDPLDPDRGDFAAYLPLDNVVTADMQFQIERLLDAPGDCPTLVADRSARASAEEEDC